MNADITALLYLVAGVLFIQALRGLSSPESSRRGNMLGIIGMVIAIGTTLASHPPAGTGAWILVVAGLGPLGEVAVGLEPRPGLLEPCLRCHRPLRGPGPLQGRQLVPDRSGGNAQSGTLGQGLAAHGFPRSDVVADQGAKDRRLALRKLHLSRHARSISTRVG